MSRSRPGSRREARSSSGRRRRSANFEFRNSNFEVLDMQSFKETLRQMIRDVRSQKLRTFLTVFGIVWGTVAVTLLLAFGRGMQPHRGINTVGPGGRARN